MAELLRQKKEENKDVRVLNATIYPDPKMGDPVLDQHIPDSEFLDLRYLRDMSKPYPYMIPSEKQFSDYMK